MIIKKRFVYIDTPQLIKDDEKITKITKEEDSTENLKKEIINKAKKDASKIISDAKNEAGEIINSAKKEAEQIKEQVLKEINGLKEEQTLKLQEEFEKFKENLQKIVNSFDKELQKSVENLSENILKVFKIIVFKLLEKEIDDEVTLRKLNKILTHLVGMKNVKLYMNPKDISLLDDEIISSFRTRGIEVIEDEKVQYGVVAETDMGTINTDLNFQMKLVNEIIDEVLNNENG